MNPRRKLLKKWMFWNVLQSALFVLYLRVARYRRYRASQRTARRINSLLIQAETLRELYPSEDQFSSNGDRNDA